MWTKLPAAIHSPILPFIRMACTLGGLIGSTAVNLKGYTMPE